MALLRSLSGSGRLVAIKMSLLTELSRSKPWRSKTPLHNAFGDGVARKAGHIMNIQFVHDLLPMFLHRLDADGEFGGDLLVGLALGNELEHLRFARSQVSAGRLFCRPSAHKGVATLV